MGVSNVIAAPMNHSRTVCSLVLAIFCIWVLRPSVAECAPHARATASPRHPQRELSALNLLGIRYAKGQGVKRNPGLAMKFFLQSANQGYTPAMANVGTLYEIGAKRDSDFQRAYAWVRAALSFGVPEEDHDETVSKLWMIAARLGPDRIESAERLSDVIATRIVETCKCLPGQEPELGLWASYEPAWNLR